MTDLKFYDAAYPVTIALAGVTGVCGYIGGDAANVWSASDWAHQEYRYRLPIWVRSNPAAANPVTDAHDCADALKNIGAPSGTVVALDSEISESPDFVSKFSEQINASGYMVVEYGSLEYVKANDNPSGWYWVASPGAKSPISGFVGTQHYWGKTYDLSWFTPSWVYKHMWDVEAPAPKPHPVPGPANPVKGMVVKGGLGSISVSWDTTRYATHYEVTLHSGDLSGPVLKKAITEAISYKFKTNLCDRHSVYGIKVRACPSTSTVNAAKANARTL